MASALSNIGLLAIVSFAIPAAVQAAPQRTPREAASYEYKGCFAGSSDGQRVLSTASYAADDMTIASCAAFCTDKNLKYFGVEYGRECYCGDTFPTAPAVAASECSFSCPGGGDPGQTCGAGGRINLYQNNLYAGRAPATIEGVPYFGCFVDQGARVLPDNLLGSDSMTTELCDAHCSEYMYFGLEYGRECWCGDITPKNLAPESECSFSCSGDNTQICGAGGRINVWARPWPVPAPVDGYEYKGCYTDRGDKHTLTGKVEYASDMTHEKCGAFCGRYGYRFFGVEYGSQCFCGVDIKDIAEERPIEECSTKCGGDSSQRCGAPDRLGIFETSGEVVPVGSPATAGAYSYKSCWTDNGAQRSLVGAEQRSDDMTVEKCAAFCGEQNFGFFGVEYGHECFCGNDLGGSAAPEEECSQLCGGSSTEFCGGPDRLNVYALDVAPTPSSSASVPPAVSSPAVSSSSVAPPLSISPSAPAPSSTASSSAPISTQAPVRRML